MKKIFLVLSFIGLVSFACIFSCDKSDQTDAPKIELGAVSDNPLQKEYVVPGGGGSHCYCPTLASCNSDCFFSSCCICWNPSNSEGACGCYFGIAKCKTAAIGKDGAQNNGGKHETHEVNIFPSRFKEFFAYLEAEKIKSDKLKSSFELLASASTKTDKAEQTRVNSGQYNTFAGEFENFIIGLEDEVRSKVLAYIDKKTNSK